MIRYWFKGTTIAVDNRVRQWRQTRGLTQRMLAKAAKTTQQMVQRVETGITPARLDVAVQLARALQVPLPELFPNLRNTLRGIPGEVRIADPRSLAAFEKAGIETDGRLWFLSYRLRGGATGALQLDGTKEYERLWHILRNNDEDNDAGHGFVLFDSDEHTVAINLRHLLYAQLLFEPARGLVEKESEERDERLLVYLSDNVTPLDFGVDPDEESLAKAEEAGDDRAVQLQSLLFYLDSYPGGSTDRLFFVDHDGEPVFLRPADIAMLLVPRACVNPELWKAVAEGLDEDANSTTGTNATSDGQGGGGRSSPDDDQMSP